MALLDAHPEPMTVKALAEKMGPSQQVTAANMLSHLEKCGLVSSRKVPGRTKRGSHAIRLTPLGAELANGLREVDAVAKRALRG